MATKEIGKIAVIAVHGVGRQVRGETADEIATMLGKTSETSTVKVGAFSSENVVIPVAGIPTKSRGGKNNDELSDDVHFSVNAVEKVVLTKEEQYYSTNVLSSVISNEARIVQSDVYELFWNDISHAQSSYARFLSEVYQVFFHIGSLGHKAVNLAAKSHANGASMQDKWVRSVNCMHRAIEFLLPTTIPILNLFLLASILPIVAILIPSNFHSVVAAAALVIGSTFLLTNLLLPSKYGGLTGIIIILLIAAALGAAALYLTEYGTDLLMLLTYVYGTSFAFFAGRKLLAKYTTPWAFYGPLLGLVVSILTICAGLYYTGNNDSHMVILSACAWSVYALFGLLQIAWLILFIISVPILFSPQIYWILTKNHKRNKTYTALKTGSIGMLISTSVFFITTSVLWAAILKELEPLLYALFYIKVPLTFGLLYQNMFNINSTLLLPEFAEALYRLTIGNTANFVLATAVCSVFIAVIGFAPAAWSEISIRKKLMDEKTWIMARWLNGAFKSLHISEWALMLGWFSLGIGYVYIACGQDYSSLVTVLGVLLAGAVPGLMVIRKKLPGGFSQVLDIFLDISNWMKERPFSRNPRARILLRYLALFKYIAEAGYDRIVIISHSQGTVITTDCLRMLEQVDSIKSFVFPRNIEIDLITAGSPLRQLYLERFPHQYGWVNPGGKTNGPDVSSLCNVKRWINIYRSSDYVGRCLWRDPDEIAMNTECAGEIEKEHDIAAIKTIIGTESDCCIGYGAHLHYFDAISAAPGKLAVSIVAP